MNSRLTDLLDLARRGETAVLVTVAQTKGSTPREAGARMVITATARAGTIGGGNLEHRATVIARELLADTTTARAPLQRFALGPSLAQCCGGVAVLLFETVEPGRAEWVARAAELLQSDEPAVLATVVDNHHGVRKLVVTDSECQGSLDDESLHAATEGRARLLLSSGSGNRMQMIQTDDTHGPTVLLERWQPEDFEIVVFGAGHVGRALIAVLAGLPCRITWIDGRADQIPSDLPGNLSALVSDTPEIEVARAAQESYFLVMTHSHALDQKIVEAVLRRDDFRYCGLIGSRSKRVRFEKRLRAAGVAERSLRRLTCPIGVNGISGKRPGEIAVAVAAQLLQIHGQRCTRPDPGPLRRPGARSTSSRPHQERTADAGQP